MTWLPYFCSNVILFWPSLNLGWILWAPGPQSNGEKVKNPNFIDTFGAKLTQNLLKIPQKSEFYLPRTKNTGINRLRQIDGQGDHIHTVCPKELDMPV